MKKLVIKLDYMDKLVWGHVIDYDERMIKGLYMKNYESEFTLSSLGSSEIPKLTDDCLFILSSKDKNYNTLPFIYEFESEERALLVYQAILRISRLINTRCFFGIITSGRGLNAIKRDTL